MGLPKLLEDQVATGADDYKIREVLLKCLETRSSLRPEFVLDATGVISYVASQLNINDTTDPNRDKQRLLLTIWNDLFREGLVAWGADIAHMNPPHCHLTNRGRELLNNISRDPRNPRGYMTNLDSLTTIDPIARSYIEESLKTFQSQCWKATAVMVGCAAECLVLLVRKTLVEQLNTANKMVSLNHGLQNNLNDWRISRVLDAIGRALSPYERTMQPVLRETYTRLWSRISEEVRLARNEAGHPKGIDSVDESTVHAILLLFPAYAKLASDLIAWIPQKVV